MIFFLLTKYVGRLVPVGYEDATGFHFGVPHKRVSGSVVTARIVRNHFQATASKFQQPSLGTQSRRFNSGPSHSLVKRPQCRASVVNFRAKRPIGARRVGLNTWHKRPIGPSLIPDFAGFGRRNNGRTADDDDSSLSALRKTRLSGRCQERIATSGGSFNAQCVDIGRRASSVAQFLARSPQIARLRKSSDRLNPLRAGLPSKKKGGVLWSP
jgi:hypothetical protein